MLSGLLGDPVRKTIFHDDTYSEPVRRHPDAAGSLHSDDLRRLRRGESEEPRADAGADRRLDVRLGALLAGRLPHPALRPARGQAHRSGHR